MLHPEGKAVLGGEEIVKSAAEGTDAWSHLYHGPDNNTQSEDQLARAPYLTQFLADPKFCPMPEVTVAAGGRIFKAMGHIAHKANQNAMLNTLLGINGYNGEILWQREVPKGFMVHRSTMIATPDVLYLGDMESCKLIDARTGQVKSEIVIPDRLADGPVWKWMAMKDGVLYALIGGHEIEVDVQPSNTPGLGHWPWAMWQGHEYADPKTNFGFGRTLVAIDPSTKRILWTSPGRGLPRQPRRVHERQPHLLLQSREVPRLSGGQDRKGPLEDDGAGRCSRRSGPTARLSFT